MNTLHTQKLLWNVIFYDTGPQLAAKKTVDPAIPNRKSIKQVILKNPCVFQTSCLQLATMAFHEKLQSASQDNPGDITMTSLEAVSHQDKGDPKKTGAMHL